MSLLILPGTQEYHLTLMTARPPCPKEKRISDNYVVDRYSQLLREVDENNLTEYLEGGECDELAEEYNSEDYIEVDLTAFLDGIIIPEPVIEL